MLRKDKLDTSIIFLLTVFQKNCDFLNQLNSNLTNLETAVTSKSTISSIKNITVLCTTSFGDGYYGSTTSLSGSKIVPLGANLSSDGRITARVRYNGNELLLWGASSGNYVFYYYLVN